MTCCSYRRLLIRASHNPNDTDGECSQRSVFNEHWKRGQEGMPEGTVGLRTSASLLGLQDLSERTWLGIFLRALHLTSPVPRTQ